MAAQWHLLTEYLLRAGVQARLTWQEFDAIVGGLPRSAVDHYPQWWHGDRPNTRAWRAAGYEATYVKPGVAVVFTRIGAPSLHGTTTPPSRGFPPRHALSPTPGAANALHGVDPGRCLIVIPCSASKNKGGRPGTPTAAAGGLAEVRHLLLADPESHTDESLVRPAWQRYQGHLYRTAAPVLSELASAQRLLILSGGYGLLEAADLIGDYDRAMRIRDWPRGLLERLLADRAANSGLDVVAVAGSTTDYAKVLRRTPWDLAPERSAHLLTTRGMRGTTAISGSLGLALRTFVEGRMDYPNGTIIERLDA